MREVEQMAASSAEVRAALDETLAALEQYAHAHAIAPNPSLKSRVMQQVEDEALEREALAAIPLRPAQDSSPYRWMFAASITLFLVSGILSVYFYSQWKQTESRLAVALAQDQQMAQNFNTVSQRMEQQEVLLRMLRDENYRPVKLQGVASHPDANVMVYWSPEQQHVYVDAVQLPEPPEGKQYQLWALRDGQPIDAGMLQLNGQTAMQQMKQIGAAQAFAITLEPEGGSQNPTLEAMYVMGEV
ncbi:hypothetical protein D1627_16065 [Pontibacter oryzae]|uniref:Anti-sigma K factor RskA C-terminal domain-containing protein n=2 Tax=Pontibacter oryzae TaxID=2304593 RepID=A0A399RWI7_9BACT|nr:hypothetical protein D1627_16065 [Pontibacter oryzae]